jgi:hypothetical protein
MRPWVFVLALGATLAPTRAHAGRNEILVGAGINSPAASNYRYATEALGYDRRGFRLAYEVEAGVLHSFNYWLSVGPLARVFIGKLGPPYDGVPAIDTYGGSIAARIEADLFPWPRLFVWCDPSVGVGSIGVTGAHNAVGFWGLRGGIGLGSTRDKSSIRFRIGYAYAPTFNIVTPWTGTFDYGGWLFQLDGVIRVSP